MQGNDVPTENNYLFPNSSTHTNFRFYTIQLWTSSAGVFI